MATLPANDPLFVHERNSELKVNFEDGPMLRGLGLVLGNSDGGDDLARKFTLRPPPSLQSIATQIQAPDPCFGVDFTASGRAANQRFMRDVAMKVAENMKAHDANFAGQVTMSRVHPRWRRPASTGCAW